MRVDIGDGVRLYVDVDGLGLVPVDGKLEERPTLLLLHGGPSTDHATFKLGMHELRDVAQVVMYDHRGQGRSDRRTAEEWNLDTWADDVVRLCDALGIEAPVVFGHSFGGFVAQRYMGRHPDHPAKAILSSTVARWTLEPVVAMFRQLGGEEAAVAATDLWTAPTPESRATYRQVCTPLYTQSLGSHAEAVDTIRTPELFSHWNSNEHHTFDTRADLANVRCPVLVLAGEFDPVCPIAGTEELVSCLPSHLVQFERFARSGHGVFRDEKDRALDVIRTFVTS
ncbi:MAG TPA: alpha/beta hydrolase [Acidimicrobiales bacterium]